MLDMMYQSYPIFPGLINRTIHLFYHSTLHFAVAGRSSFLMNFDRHTVHEVLSIRLGTT